MMVIETAVLNCLAAFSVAFILMLLGATFSRLLKHLFSGRGGNP